MGARLEIGSVLQSAGGVIVTSSHPELEDAVKWLARRGELVRLLPATYCAADRSGDPLVRMHAVLARYPDAVLIRAAAARVSYWSKVPLATIEVASPGRIRPQPGFTFVTRRIPPELLVEGQGWRFTTPALTALDLASFDDTDPIDVALRTRAATLALMYEALRLTPGRAGNRERTRLLLDSRDNPWSAAERRAQRLLRQAGIEGWQGNLPIILRGQERYLDIGFTRLRLCLEIDGRIHQLDPALFESDRARQNALVLGGWMVLRFTWLMIENEPEALIADVREAVQLRRSQLRRSGR